MGEVQTRIPTLYVEGEGVTDTFYKALKAVHERDFEIRTQYDRTNSDGSYIDSPSRDARTMVRVENLFAEPRFPKVCWSEWGKYIAEMMGVKDHLVMPHKELLERIHSGNEDFEAKEWPYCYHQRLTAYPKSDGTMINQLEMVAEKLAKDPITRRAVAMTGVPEIDLFMKADMPCLRELQFRAIEDEEGRLVVNTFARWRSRAMYTAWPDNIIGIRNLLQFEVVPLLEEKTGKKVILGPYSEENGSLHIYGQDYLDKGADKFFEVNSSLDGFLKDSQEKQGTFDELIIDQLKELKGETTWQFPAESITLIDTLIGAYESGNFKP